MEKIMIYDFTNASPREYTNSEKYVLRKKLYGTDNLEPIWVADMDIDSPIFVKEAILKRAEHQIYGYEKIKDETFLAQILWLNKHYNTNYTLDEVLYSHSVVASMNVFIEAFSQEDDEIIVQTPIYPPFFTSVERQKRKLLLNPLKKDKEGIFRFDLGSLKSKITPKTKLLLLCNPHNPVGRSWSKKELQDIVNICKEHNILMYSDEIHCDLVYNHTQHIPVSIIEDTNDILVSTYSIGKTFNLSGLRMGTIMIQDNNLRRKFQYVYDKYHFSDGNILSHEAFYASYTHGEQWLKQLKEHLYENYTKLKNLCEKYNNIIKISPIEATYLAWLDCTGMNLGKIQLKDFFINEAKLGLSEGLSFGQEGKQYMRLNFAVSKIKMDKIIKLLDKALDGLSA
jgi:cystathionine beta-lyase